jgi:putative Holliday junction resolvase
MAKASAGAGARTEPGLLLAFDFGLRHIGWATGQHLTASATAGSALAAQEGTPNWQAVQALLDEWQPVRIIVGLPLNMDETENDMCARARRFARRLEGRFGIPVTLQDERLSSREAGDRFPHRDRNDRHGEAARIILEDYLRQPAS